MTCSSYITSYERLTKEFDGVVGEAKALGAKYVLTAEIPRTGRFTLEDCQKAVMDFNRWGEKLKAQQLQFGYHAHGFEFVPTDDGTILWSLRWTCFGSPVGAPIL